MLEDENIGSYLLKIFNLIDSKFSINVLHNIVLQKSIWTICLKATKLGQQKSGGKTPVLL